MMTKIDYLEDNLACLRGENTALKEKLAQFSINYTESLETELDKYFAEIDMMSGFGCNLHELAIRLNSAVKAQLTEGINYADT